MPYRSNNQGPAKPRIAPVAQAPALPQPPEAQPQPEAQPGLQAAADAPAQALVTPPTDRKNPAQSPEELTYDEKDDFERGMKQLQQNLMKNPGALSAGLAQALNWLVYLRRMYKGIFPGDYMAGLDTGPMASVKLSEQDQAKVMTPAPLKTLDKSSEAEKKTLLEALKAAKTLEEASTMYVCSMLGITRMTAPDSLAASLKHAEKDGEFLYRSEATTYIFAADDPIPRGTVLIFRPVSPDGEGDIMASVATAGDTACAVATGNGREFIYYDPKKGEVKFNLDDTSTQFFSAVRSVFVPRFNTDHNYFEKHPEQLSKKIDATPYGKLNRWAVENENYAASVIDAFNMDESYLALIPHQKAQTNLDNAKKLYESINVPPFEEGYKKMAGKKYVEILESTKKMYTTILQKLTDKYPEEKHSDLMKFSDVRPTFSGRIDEINKELEALKPQAESL